MSLKCIAEMQSIIDKFITYDDLITRTYLLLQRLSDRCSKSASGIFESEVDPVKERKDMADFMYEISQVLKFISESLELQGDDHSEVIDIIKKELGIVTYN
jgi:NMD protein affecting ribosome stability and mRNA decay